MIHGRPKTDVVDVEFMFWCCCASDKDGGDGSGDWYSLKNCTSSDGFMYFE